MIPALRRNADAKIVRHQLNKFLYVFPDFRAEEDDLFQLGLIAAWSCEHSYRPSPSAMALSSWKFLHVRGALFAYCFSAATKKRRDMQGLSDALIRNTAADGESPERTCERAQLDGCVRTVLGKVKGAELLRDFFLKELSIYEIATERKTSWMSIYKRMARTKRALQPILEPLWAHGDATAAMGDCKRPPRRLKTHCVRGHPLSGENLRTVTTSGVRQCRACHRESDKRRRSRSTVAEAGA